MSMPIKQSVKKNWVATKNAATEKMILDEIRKDVSNVKVSLFAMFGLTWNNEVSNFRISVSERIEDPPTGNKESLVTEIIWVWERVKTMNPEAELVELGAIKPRVHLQPVRGHEAGGDEDNHDEAEAEGHVPRQSPLPVGICVWKQVIPDTHGG